MNQTHCMSLLNVHLKVDAAVGSTSDSEVALAEQPVPALAHMPGRWECGLLRRLQTRVFPE